MSSPLSSDLCERVVHAVKEGFSHRGAAPRFGVGLSSAIRWQESFAQEGGVAAKLQGGDLRSRHVEAHVDLILGLEDSDDGQVSLTDSDARSVATSGRGTGKRFKRWTHEDVLEAMQRRLDALPDAMAVRRAEVEHVFGS